MSSEPVPRETDEHNDEVRGAKSEPAPSKSPEFAPQQTSAVEAMRLWLRLVNLT